MSDEAIFLFVLGLRLGIPLLIPRFPLPAILAALVIDAADQTIFQNNTDLDLTNYQGYDKALDVYYLTIAYLSTIRNWHDPFAYRVAQFLWYYRLVGVLLFEITEVRALLIIFPNTFEYFFIAYEFVRLWWDPSRLTKRQVVGMAAVIWIFIKLPQEWWIHIAQLDFTDFMKEDVFGVSVDTSWGEAISQNLWFVALLAIVGLVVVLGIIWLRRRVPEPDHRFGFDVDRTLEHGPRDEPLRPVEQPLWSWYQFEKIALVSMVIAIFALVVPDTDMSGLGIIAAVAWLIIVNSFVSGWLARRDTTWTSTIRAFTAMAAVNVVSLVLFDLVVGNDETNVGAALFFVLLLTLIVTLYDRFMYLRLLRESEASPPPDAAPARP